MITKTINSIKINITSGQWKCSDTGMLCENNEVEYAFDYCIVEVDGGILVW